jgi:spore germination cell wall hydrolase CwlJ-like protein
MAVSRKRPKGVRYYAPFGLSVLAMGLMPRSIGYQDLVALMAQQTAVPQRVRAHMLTSPFGTIHAATFSFPQPVGTQIPEPPLVQLASIGAYDLESTGSLGRNSSGPPIAMRPRVAFPTVNRRLKGDLLVSRPHDGEIPAEGTRDLTPGRVKTVSFPKPGAVANTNAAQAKPADAKPTKSPASIAEPKVSDAKAGDANRFEKLAASYEVASLQPAEMAKPTEPASPPMDEPAATAGETENDAAVRLDRLYFGNVIGDDVGPIQPWPADEELVIESAPPHDPDINRSALASPMSADFNFETSGAAPMPGETMAAPPEAFATGEMVALKGEVTGAGKRPKTPAERLNLDDKQRAKSEKCLAEAVYFESRGEVKRGQIAVAQVVMNRVFSGFYPNNVCGTVYQNAHRKFACQFTFACDNVRDVIDEPDMWQQAKEIARDMLDGKLWLPEIGHSTHYHAYWVHPSWVNEMRKLHKIGVHSFYRPRAWGDTVEVPNHPFVPPNPRS